ncbi:MAG: hypothetical protein KGJ84_14960 [Elusimicrobia bacterium]|nr:hypothetical protein [Elusimicrobiota bacterium]
MGLMILQTRTLAWLGLAGTVSDAVGGLYLTYELLGGNRGPLGLLTRAATYGLIFALGYGLAFGPFFGAVAGVGLGGILALEFWRVAYYQRTRGYSPLYNVRSAGAARGVVLGLAAMTVFGWQFGAIFAGLNAVFMFAVYHLSFAPVQDYAPSRDLRLSPHARNAAVFRAVAVGISGGLTGWIEARHVHAAGFGLTIGLVVGLTGLVLGAVTPVIEWWVENLPERTLATVGFLLIALGLVLQSVQYVTVLLVSR